MANKKMTALPDAPAIARSSSVWLKIVHGLNSRKLTLWRAVSELATPTALVDGATVTPDFGAAHNFTWSLAGNRTLANPTNLTEGQSGIIRITNTGAFNITAWGNNWRVAGGTPVLSSGAGKVDILAYAVIGGVIYATLSKDFTQP